MPERKNQRGHTDYQYMASNIHQTKYEKPFHITICDLGKSQAAAPAL